MPPPGVAAPPLRDEVMAMLDGDDTAEPAEDAAEPGFPERPAAGLWTHGGARLPPMVWEIEALPAPEEFAMLLDVPA